MHYKKICLDCGVKFISEFDTNVCDECVVVRDNETEMSESEYLEEQ